MKIGPETIARLAKIPNLAVSEGALLSRYTRFGIGGPARVYAETADQDAFISALDTVTGSGVNFEVIGGGTNLIVSDSGIDGVVLRFTADSIESDGARIRVAAGAVLQTLVYYSTGKGMKGLETMTGIPGSVGAAIYGNAGAYGHSIMERISTVRFFDGAGIRVFDNAQCEFRYRESVFKHHKEWIIFSAELNMDRGDAALLRAEADR